MLVFGCNGGTKDLSGKKRTILTFSKAELFQKLIRGGHNERKHLNDVLFKGLTHLEMTKLKASTAYLTHS